MRVVQEGRADGDRHGAADCSATGSTTEQEVLSFAADVLIDAYAAESAVAARLAGHAAAPSPLAALHECKRRACSVSRGGRHASRRGRKSALAATAEGDTLRTLLAALRRVLQARPREHGRA